MSNILITGTTKGLGKTIAEFYLGKGWNVIGIARSQKTIEHNNYKHIICDIRNQNDLYDAFRSLDDIKLDVLVHNSAVFEMRKFENTLIKTIDDIIDTNLKAPMYITKYALPLMNVDSRIFFINSVAGLEELYQQSVYCASKYGLTAFAGVLGNELRSKGIKITSIHPGGIDTTLWNEDNPYPCGNVIDAINAKDIAFLMDFIYNSSSNVEYKTVKLFPTTEWHQ